MKTSPAISGYIGI